MPALGAYEGDGQLEEMPPTYAPTAHGSLAFRIIRLILRRFIRGGVFIARAFWQHRTSSALVLVLGSLLILTNLDRMFASAPTETLPPQAIESYIDGQRNFDAQEMWDSMSEDLRAEFGSVVLLQRRLEQSRIQGSRIIDSKMVGGSELDDGRRVFLYIVSVEQESGVRQVPYMFTVNPNGKIAQID